MVLLVVVFVKRVDVVVVVVVLLNAAGVSTVGVVRVVVREVRCLES